MLVEEQNRRITELEEAVRSEAGRELEPLRDEQQAATAVPEVSVGDGGLTLPESPETLRRAYRAAWKNPQL